MSMSGKVLKSYQNGKDEDYKNIHSSVNNELSKVVYHDQLLGAVQYTHDILLQYLVLY